MPDPSFEKILTPATSTASVKKGAIYVLVKNWIFDDPFNKKMTSIGYFGASDQEFFFEEIGI